METYQVCRKARMASTCRGLEKHSRVSTFRAVFHHDTISYRVNRGESFALVFLLPKFLREEDPLLQVSLEKGRRLWRRPTFAPPVEALSLGLQRFTSVFGKGTGGTTAL